jgi:hypothetical protein
MGLRPDNRSGGGKMLLKTKTRWMLTVDATDGKIARRNLVIRSYVLTDTNFSCLRIPKLSLLFLLRAFHYDTHSATFEISV